MIAAPKSHLNALLTSRHCTPLSRAAELMFVQRAHSGDRRAADRLVMANMKFVASVARKYQNQGLSVEDLVQEGAIGLQRAIEKFNPCANIRLISYAVWWVRQRMLLALAEQARALKIPTRFHDLGSKAERTRRKLEQRQGRPVSQEEVADAMGMPLDALREALGALHDAESLDVLVTEDASRMDFLAGEARTDAGYEEKEERENIQAILKSLDPSDQEIISRIYGLKTGEAETLEEAGIALGVSKERIRQRKERAIPRLRKRAEKMRLFTPTAVLDAKRPEPVPGEGKWVKV